MGSGQEIVREIRAELRTGMRSEPPRRPVLALDPGHPLLEKGGDAIVVWPGELLWLVHPARWARLSLAERRRLLQGLQGADRAAP